MTRLCANASPLCNFAAMMILFIVQQLKNSTFYTLFQATPAVKYSVFGKNVKKFF
jgi:hypothetical protein